MAKGPSYTEEEQKLLDVLAKKGGSPTVLATEFTAQFGSERSMPALIQKIRKMMIALEENKAAKKAAKSSQTASSSSAAPVKRKPGRPAKVNAAPLSDAPPAPAKKRGRPPKALTLEGQLASSGTSAITVPSSNGNGQVTVDLGEGLILVGSKKRVGEMLQKLA